MTARYTVIAAALVLQMGCITHFERGTFSAVSTKAVPLSMKTVRAEVDGKDCFFSSFFGYDGAYRRAVKDALAKAPGANALVNASYTLGSFCVVAHGTAVHVD